MSYQKFFINLKRCPERANNFDETWTRAPAVDYRDLDPDHHMFERMVSYWNLNPHEHKAKTACWMSHYNILKKISEQRLMRCIVVEDDAQMMNELPAPHELGNEYTYLYYYPARFVEAPGPSMIRAKKTKHCTTEYMLV